MVDITQANIDKVKTNIQNMKSFNDYVYDSGNAYIANCYLLLSEPDSSDPGNAFGIGVLEGAMGALFSLAGPVGAFASCFMCDIISGWYAAIPTSLNTNFGSTLIRVDRSHVELDTDMTTYQNDPATYWNETFTWNGKTITLGDLSTIDFPDSTQAEFYTLVTASLIGFNQGVWVQTLRINCTISWLMPYTNSQCTEIKGKTDINAWYAGFLPSHPAYYCTWSWHGDTGLFDHDYWYVDEYILNFKDGTAQKFRCIPDAACAYLFIDSTDGVVINSNGLFPRKTVFNDLGINRRVISTATPT